jgi:hypothetical protein
MIVQKFSYLEEQELGALLGIFESGIKSRWLLGEEWGMQTLAGPLRLRHIVIDPGKSFPAQRNEYKQTIFIISGKGVFRSMGKDFGLEEGDLACLDAEELYSILNTGDAPLKLLYTAVDTMVAKYSRRL